MTQHPKKVEPTSHLSRATRATACNGVQRLVQTSGVTARPRRQCQSILKREELYTHDFHRRNRMLEHASSGTSLASNAQICCGRARHRQCSSTIIANNRQGHECEAHSIANRMSSLVRHDGNATSEKSEHQRHLLCCRKTANILLLTISALFLLLLSLININTKQDSM